jgi:Chaperone for flagella basal body P-ring formation
MRSSFVSLILWVGAAMVCARNAHADPIVRTVTGPRIELHELVPTVPELMREVDIAPSPAVGASQLIDRDTIIRQVKAAGFDAREVTLPPVIRAERPGRKYTEAELSALLNDAVTRALPAGVTLIQLAPAVALTLDETATPGPIVLPKLPKRVGTVKVTFSVEFATSDGIGRRLPISAIVNMNAEAASSTIARGSLVQLSIQSGAATVAADGTSLGDGNIGEKIRFRVNRTGKVLWAVLTSPTKARVVTDGRE